MTLFFIRKELKPGMGKRFDESRTQAAAMADVVVLVDDEDRWLTTKDRHTSHGAYLHPRRKVELLNEYYVLIRPTN